MLAAKRPPLASLAEDHALMCEAVRAAGAVVLDHYHRQYTKNWLKDDASPISEADLAANVVLKDLLLAGRRANYGWLSEECPDAPSRLSADRTWVIDPIDGTRAFLQKRPEFAVCAALIEDSQIVVSALYNPVTEEFFEAQLGRGAYCNGARLRVSRTCDMDHCRMLGHKQMFTHPKWPSPWPGMRIKQRNSTGYRMALVAKGLYDATIALVPKADWDVAPGALIAHEAGAQLSDHLGAPFRFNQVIPEQRGLVCATPGVYPDVIARLAHLPADLRTIKTLIISTERRKVQP